MLPLRLPSSLLFVACVAALVLGSILCPEYAEAGALPAASAAQSPPPPADEASVIYPTQRLPLEFDHLRHAKVGTGCVYCHEGATTSRTSADRLLPPPSRCDACHGTNHDRLDRVTPGVGPAAECSFCHSGQSAAGVERVVLPSANLHFDHAAHTSRKIACETCHAGARSSALVTTAALPRMQACVSCHHTGGSAKAGCDVCHVTTVGGRLETSFPSGKLFPGTFRRDSEHGPDWTFRHKLVAGADSASCSSCHSEEECVDCHDGRVRPRRVHPNDWLGLHAMSARQEEASCSSCHRAATFCVTCHQRAGVAMSGPVGNAADRGRFHPPKAVWTDPPRTPRHHAWEAERNITACVSCHTERDCASCHASAARGGQGGLSPHPPGFSATCGGALSKNARPCLFCHDAADPSLSRCR